MPEQKKLVFATFFPGCENVHLIKDVGMIPYVMHRDYGYDSCLICYDRDDYTHLKDLPGLRLLFMKGRQSRLFNGEDIRSGPYWFVRNWIADKTDVLITLKDTLPIMLKHSRQIDVLQLYHFKYESLIIALLYRMINRKGLLYLKLDTNPGIVDYYQKNPGKLKNMAHLSYLLFKLASFDIISAESVTLYKFLRNVHPLYRQYKDRIYCIPNGIDISNMRAESNTLKENIVLHVARMGDKRKGSDLALEAFARASPDFPDWKLLLIGSMEPEFRERFDALMSAREDLKGHIVYAGFINDRKTMSGYYQKAKILLMPSRSESFGFAGVEAGALGDVIVGSDIPAIKDMTDNGKLGYLCPVDDIPSLEKALSQAMSHEEELARRSRLVSAFTIENFNLSRIYGRLNSAILDKRAR